MVCKAGILTFHRALNYGAVFQTYALQRGLTKMGVDAEVIDYRAEFNERRFKRKKIRQLMHLRELYSVLLANSYQLFDRSAFENFCSKIPLSEPCFTREELKAVCSQYDRIVCGSDQVWNLACTEGDDSYFLPFLQNPHKKVSYAASLGYEILPERYRECCRKWIGDYSAISVREKSGVKIVNELTGKQAEYVVDPTLLLMRQEWLEQADYKRVPSKRYILLYLMSEDKRLIAFARNLARQNDLQLVYISDRLFRMRGAQNLRKVTPEEWLGLFERADYIVTNSFHGTAFSVNFGKQFFVRYIPRSIANTRLRCILEEYGLQRRVIDDWDGQKCDFREATDKLANNRRLSYQFIREQIVGE